MLIYQKNHSEVVRSVTHLKRHVFLMAPQNMECEYSLEPSRRGGSNE